MHAKTVIGNMSLSDAWYGIKIETNTTAVS